MSGVLAQASAPYWGCLRIALPHLDGLRLLAIQRPRSMASTGRLIWMPTKVRTFLKRVEAALIPPSARSSRKQIAYCVAETAERFRIVLHAAACTLTSF